MLKVSKEMIITWLNQFSSTQIEGDMTSFFSKDSSLLFPMYSISGR